MMVVETLRHELTVVTHVWECRRTIEVADNSSGTLDAID